MLANRDNQLTVKRNLISSTNKPSINNGIPMMWTMRSIAGLGRWGIWRGRVGGQLGVVGVDGMLGMLGIRGMVHWIYLGHTRSCALRVFAWVLIKLPNCFINVIRALQDSH
jgi:hypothetical protein